MDEKKDIRGLFEEDDGEEITSKKATLEDIAAKEKEEEKQAKPVLTVEEQKAKDKKSNKLTGIIMGSIIGVAIILGEDFGHTILFYQKLLEVFSE